MLTHLSFRVAVVTFFLAFGSRGWGQAPDLIVHGAVAATMDPRYPEATAIATRGSRIVAVGSDQDILARRGKETRVVDAKGAFLMPGFIEGHGHFQGLGASRRSVDLIGCASYDELIRRVKIFIGDQPKGTWITGRGWDQNLWPDRQMPDHEPLSRAFPDYPVFLKRVDGHAALANAAAMNAAGLTNQTANMTGGEILRDASGKATGVFIDRAMGLFAELLPNDDDREVIETDLLLAQELCFREGITTFHDAGSSHTLIALMASLMEADRLKIRL
ncbi:MAG: amidohydrolase family protein, partial [Planctomycetes bacterium]|nr:amidohydrolase family protein [Planctomycetota bacterium]